MRIFDRNASHLAGYQRVITFFEQTKIMYTVHASGLMLATKNRYEFRVRLQKRTRMRLEKKLESVRDDLDWQTVGR